ncbi:hypothetical protein VIGAN_04349600, partial [Vigna angularis var. angularis]
MYIFYLFCFPCACSYPTFLKNLVGVSSVSQFPLKLTIDVYIKKNKNILTCFAESYTTHHTRAINKTDSHHAQCHN